MLKMNVLREIIHLYLEGKDIRLIHLELLNSYVMLSKLKSRHEETSSSHYSGNSNHLYKQLYCAIKTFNMNNIQPSTRFIRLGFNNISWSGNGFRQSLSYKASITQLQKEVA